MRADLDRNGILHIRPDNGCEAYALTKWCEKGIDISKILIYHDFDVPLLNTTAKGERKAYDSDRTIF